MPKSYNKYSKTNINSKFKNTKKRRYTKSKVKYTKKRRYTKSKVKHTKKRRCTKSKNNKCKINKKYSNVFIGGSFREKRDSISINTEWGEINNHV